MTSFYFANSAGLWALLGIPAILLIHLLQQKTRRLPVSTLFLLQNLTPESVPGRSLQKLRRSVPLALQLLMVLLLAWMLAEPRWLKAESIQTVVVVVDSSASMSAFRDPAIAALKDKIADWEKGVARTEWILMESDGKRSLLYRGEKRSEFLQALDSWKPESGSHDWAPILELAQTVRGNQGRIVVLTDRPLDLPAGVGLLAVGKPLPNVGFSGVVVEEEKGVKVWRATVQNYSTAAQSRSWQVEAGGLEAKPQAITLEPGQLRVLSGTFPPGLDRLELVLTADDFPLDDRLPILLPAPKPLTYVLAAGGETGSYFQRLASGVPAFSVAANPGEADLTVIGRRLGQPVRESGSALLFYLRENAEGAYNLQSLVAEDHPLVRDINWQGLLSGGPGLFEKTEADRVLLWQGNQPLILLRENNGAKVLIFNFDFEHSNASRLPAFVVLLNRFLESLRSDKLAGWSANFETGQLLDLKVNSDQGGVEYSGPDGKESWSVEKSSAWRAPRLPGFFEIQQRGLFLLKGAAHFGDPREADLSGASFAERFLDVSEESRRRNTEADPFLPLWLLAVASTLGLSWWWQSSLRKKAGVSA